MAITTPGKFTTVEDVRAATTDAAKKLGYEETLTLDTFSGFSKGDTTATYIPRSADLGDQTLIDVFIG